MAVSLRCSGFQLIADDGSIDAGLALRRCPASATGRRHSPVFGSERTVAQAPSNRLRTAALRSSGGALKILAAFVVVAAAAYTAPGVVGTVAFMWGPYL